MAQEKSMGDIFGNWYMDMEEHNIVLRLALDRSQLLVDFRKTNSNGWVSLGSIAEFLELPNPNINNYEEIKNFLAAHYLRIKDLFNNECKLRLFSIFRQKK